MATCEVCGNEYANGFVVVMHGKEHPFDSFECAIQALAPVCRQCQCRVIGHGVETDDDIYCSAHCARKAGVTGIVDHV